MNDKPPSLKAPVILYYLTLSAMFLASLFPDYRVWGINWWGYFPSYITVSIFTLGAVLPILFLKLPFDYNKINTIDDDPKLFTSFSIIYILIAVLLFIALHTKTHFLGDGYQNVARLIGDPLVKYRELGESLAHISLYNLIGENQERGAYLSYQIISIVAGLFYLVALVIASRKLFPGNRDRNLFLVGSSLAGFTLLFFGYVENYSIFVLSVTIFALNGLLIINGKSSRYWALPLFALTVFFHVLGITLLPALVYLLLSGNRTGAWIAQRSVLIRLSSLLVVLISASYLFYYFWHENYFFRFAFVPLFEGQFVVEGYTLFSLKHLVDILNLLALLFPPLFLFFTFGRSEFSSRSSRFLIVLILASAGAAFIFDPKIGMPRDWDLFSFVGVPLSFLFFYTLLKSGFHSRFKIIVSLLAISLCLLTLGPRVAALNSDPIAIAHFKNYLKLDHIKNRNGHFLLVEYYRHKEDSVNFAFAYSRWKSTYPDQQLMDSAETLKLEGRCDEAIPVYLSGLAINPTHPDLWQQLGECYITKGMISQAEEALRISNGLNPNNATTINNLGASYLFAGEPKIGLKYLKRAKAIDSTLERIHYNLVAAYKMSGRYEEYEEALRKVTQFKSCPADYHLALIVYCINTNRPAAAEDAYQQAISSGVDIPTLDSICNIKF